MGPRTRNLWRSRRQRCGRAGVGHVSFISKRMGREKAMVVFRHGWGSAVRAVVAGAGLLLATAASAAEVKEVRFGFGYGLVYLPIMVADAQGYFVAQAKKAG